MIDQRERFERAFQRFEMPEPAFERLARRRERKQRNQRVAAGAVGLVVFVASVWAVTSRDPAGSERTPGSSGGPGPVATGPDLGLSGIPGLPPRGMPTTSVNGELVLRQSSPYGSLSVYDDGSLIWSSKIPDGADAHTGLTMQRLTPEGIEYLRSAILETGLFTHDLELDGGGSQPYLEIEVQNGDRLVDVRLVWEGALLDPNAPEATAEQERALDTLAGLLGTPERWPENAWADRTMKTFVPGRYRICFRGFPHHLTTSETIALLPSVAADLISDRLTDGDGVPCGDLPTDETRGLAEALDSAGLTPMLAETWLRYNLDVPDSRDELWIFFMPVLPHGEAIFLGPG